MSDFSDIRLNRVLEALPERVLCDCCSLYGAKRDAVMVARWVSVHGYVHPDTECICQACYMAGGGIGGPGYQFISTLNKGK